MKKIQWIVGLKGICALIVMLRHYVNAFLPALHTGNEMDAKIFLEDGSSIEAIVNSSPLYLFINGGFAVYIFWILSAFLISYSYYTASSMEAVKLENVLKKKVLKKYLSLLGVIGIVYICVYIMMKLSLFFNTSVAGVIENEWMLGFYSWEPTIGQMFISWFFDTFLNANVPFDPVLWTIKIEFLGSILEICLLNLFGTWKYRGYIWGICFCFILFFFPMQYLCFFIGILLGELYVKKLDRNNMYIKVVSIILFVGGIFWGGSYPADFQPSGKLFGWVPMYVGIGPYAWDTRTLIFIVSATAIIISMVLNVDISKIFENRVFMYFGKYSLEIYMLHFVILCSFSSWEFVWLYDKIRNYGVLVLVVLLSALLMTMVCSKLLNKANYIYNKELNEFVKKIVEE